MRPTNLNFRNPAELTADFKEATMTHNGVSLFNHRAISAKPGSSSVKGTIPQEKRRRLVEDRLMKEMQMIGPGSYNPHDCFKRLTKPKCATVFSRKPANAYCFENPSEFIMVGDQVKHFPQENLASAAGCRSQSRKRNIKTTGPNHILNPPSGSGIAFHWDIQSKSLKKIVEEENARNDQMTVKDIYLEQCEKFNMYQVHKLSRQTAKSQPLSQSHQEPVASSNLDSGAAPVISQGPSKAGDKQGTESGLEGGPNAYADSSVELTNQQRVDQQLMSYSSAATGGPGMENSQNIAHYQSAGILRNVVKPNEQSARNQKADLLSKSQELNIGTTSKPLLKQTDGSSAEATRERIPLVEEVGGKPAKDSNASAFEGTKRLDAITNDTAGGSKSNTQSKQTFAQGGIGKEMPSHIDSAKSSLERTLPGVESDLYKKKNSVASILMKRGGSMNQNVLHVVEEHLPNQKPRLVPVQSQQLHTTSGPDGALRVSAYNPNRVGSSMQKGQRRQSAQNFTKKQSISSYQTTAGRMPTETADHLRDSINGTAHHKVQDSGAFSSGVKTLATTVGGGGGGGASGNIYDRLCTTNIMHQALIYGNQYNTAQQPFLSGRGSHQGIESTLNRGVGISASSAHGGGPIAFIDHAGQGSNEDLLEGQNLQSDICGTQSLEDIEKSSIELRRPQTQQKMMNRQTSYKRGWTGGPVRPNNTNFRIVGSQQQPFRIGSRSGLNGSHSSMSKLQSIQLRQSSSKSNIFQTFEKYEKNRYLQIHQQNFKMSEAPAPSEVRRAKMESGSSNLILQKKQIKRSYKVQNRYLKSSNKDSDASNIPINRYLTQQAKNSDLEGFSSKREPITESKEAKAVEEDAKHSYQMPGSKPGKSAATHPTSALSMQYQAKPEEGNLEGYLNQIFDAKEGKAPPQKKSFPNYTQLVGTQYARHKQQVMKQQQQKRLSSNASQKIRLASFTKY